MAGATSCHSIKGQLMVRFMPANELKERYDVFGHFYSVEVAPNNVVDCRSVLEIVEKAQAPDETSAVSHRTPDAVFIMMNPGSSRPLVEVNNRIHADFVGSDKTRHNSISGHAVDALL
jgi:hypothetical protein